MHQRRWAIYVYGTWGMASLLVCQGKWVVYLPDCLRCYVTLYNTSRLPSYSPSRMPCLANKSTVVRLSRTSHHLHTSQNWPAVQSLPITKCSGTWNHTSGTFPWIRAKSELLAILQRISHTHIYITSASANHESAPPTSKRKNWGTKKCSPRRHDDGERPALLPAKIVILFAEMMSQRWSVYNAARYYFNFNTGPILPVKLEVILPSEVKLK